MCQRNREMKVFCAELSRSESTKSKEGEENYKHIFMMEGDSGGDDVDYCVNCGGDAAPVSTSSQGGRRRRKGSDTVCWTVEEVMNSGTRARSQLFVINKLVKMAVTLVVLILLGGASSIIQVSAVDLNPHGGFYQREGGLNSFRPSSTQQSFFGGGGGGVGGGGGGGLGLGHGGGHGSSSPDFSDDMMSDMIMTCSRPVKSSRAAKYLAIKRLDIPCDMGDKKSAWCNLPGDKYPWHAVRRFVFENQGLMRRMYGEVRQLSLLRMEFEDDMDDEMEDERHAPPRSPPIPEDHRRNSILTEVLDESLPRVLSETPPEDQLILKEHQELFRESSQSTPRSLSSSFPSSSSSEPVMMTSTSTSATTSTGAATTTPVMMSSSSEEQMNSTEVMLGVTVDSLSGSGVVDLNGTTFTTPTGETENTASTLGMTTNIGRNGLTEDFLVTEEVTQATTGSATGSVTEMERETAADGESSEATVTTTEEMLGLIMNEQTMSLGVDEPQQQLLDVGEAAPSVGVVEPIQQHQQQLNDGLDASGSLGGSDESHDFLNLDKNHILYFDDVGKNRRPVGGGNSGGGAAAAAGGGSGDYVPQAAQVPPSQQGKLKAVNACPVKEEVVAPYWANNTRGEILALLNLYPFEQYIHWERCNHENKQMFCRQGCRCEQQYRLHRLLAFDPTNECRGIFSDWFRFPSCCVCRCYLNEYELMMLNAAGQDPPPGSSSSAAKSRTSDRIRSPRKLLLDQLVDGPDVQGVDDMHFFYKQGFSHEHNHGAQPRRKRNLFSQQENPY